MHAVAQDEHSVQSDPGRDMNDKYPADSDTALYSIYNADVKRNSRK